MKPVEWMAFTIVALCETTKIFETIEALLDTVAVFVKSPVVRDDYLAVPL
ncbi:hypothetical protein GWA01_03600 [Gluconobacter wancherniae NBRC 103581]|uniref:Uncharacterized protein n=1 Tax=Gluconobacter wancherniae NBRC 103581 TaxID=656744 RepID=A0A511AWK8_9PROT|nr:hypothetical protein [Gluconobacter wancherniae]GBR64006.1 hypothetical protein AA103581_1094 [Gluconobacter wancherniae NBRC 103581]GEK92590.1 hypothetical protein GWA01_03600 [Gluconobacter wancherniae NBRC 103581]